MEMFRKENKMNKLRILFMSILIILSLATLFVTIAKAEDTIYEKDGCIYIIGNPTFEETQALEKYRQYRIITRRIQVEREIERAHIIQIEIIRADAIKYGIEYQAQLEKEQKENAPKSYTFSNVSEYMYPENIYENPGTIVTIGDVTNTNTNRNTNSIKN